MKQKKIIVVVIVLVLASLIFGTSIAMAGNPKPGKFDDRGNVTDWLYDPGFDEFGYNYNAWMFSGRYCDYDRVIGGDYCDVDLIMKWSPEWISRVDSNDDEKLDRGYIDCRGEGTNPDLTQSHCPGAWLTNHQRGQYEQDGKICKWTYFVKFVYPGYMPTDTDNDGLDEASGGRIVWGAYIVTQSVENDPCAGLNGISELIQPAGFGTW